MRAGLLLALLPLAAHAGAMQDQAAVAAAVRQAALALAPPGATLSLGPVAGAAYMQACAQPLVVTISGVAPYEQAAAHCPAPAWTLYVTVTVAQSEAVVVAARPVAAGQVIGPDDLTLRTEPVQNFAGRPVFYDTSSLLGGTASMSLAAGMVLTQDDVQEPVAVKSGQMVTVRVISGGVEVSIDAVAGETGRLGDTVLFTNPASGRRFPALITPDGPVVRLQS
jgi:flagella basal body P-ring formation protein FlgA